MDDIFDRFRPYITLILFAMAGLGLYLIYEKTAGMESTPIVIEKCSEESDNTAIYVDISGEVKKPGVKELPTGSRVYDVVEAGGGFKLSADMKYIAQSINLAEVVTDGYKLYIPKQGEMKNNGASSFESGKTITSKKKISINSASAEELTGLPGIGEVYARRIVEGRPYGSVDELKNIKGIGDKTFEEIKDLISL